MKFGLDNLNPAVFGAVHQTRVQNASSAHDGALLNSQMRMMRVTGVQCGSLQP
jgi:hypothetical protein